MRNLIRPLSMAWLFASALVTTASAVDLEGSLELLNRKGSRPARGVDPQEAVVWWEADEAVPVAALEGGAEMATKDKEFDPRILIVSRGTTVRFPNNDPILHNVFSVSGENSFDLGLYRKGPGESYVFEHEGVVRIFCNVHHSMVGYVLVLDSPYVARPDESGRFVLEGLPDGTGRLMVWHERGEEPMGRELVLPAEGKVELSLKMTRARVPKHLNKVGREYARPSDEY